MPSDPINGAYARALFEMCQAEGALDRVLEQSFQLRQLLKSNPALLAFLNDFNVPPEGKRRALSELLQERLHPVLLNMLMTLADQSRLGRVVAIVEEFERVAAGARRKLTAEVITAVPMDDRIMQRLGEELTRLSGKQVEVFPKVDPGIIGGAIIKIGNQIIDASLRHRLEQMRTQLAR
ncbi:MAG: ATP synthase F1 subunit delta [Verrucomicrobiae bacterium]|nr:ATP synthase F1 subunit delta [Verrucomicrobiae bacterium]